MRSVPAISIEAVLIGLQGLGIPTQQIRQKLALKPRYTDPTELLPSETVKKVWNLGRSFDPRPELPTLVAYQIPFGFFGPADYLAGTAQTVRGAIQSLADHFASVSKRFTLEVNLPPKKSGSLRVLRQDSSDDWVSDEFVVSMIIGRFKDVGKFIPSQIYLTSPFLENKPHEEIFGAPVVYGATRAGFDVEQIHLDFQQETVDPNLHRLLLEVAKKLNLEGPDHLESAVRCRLRDLLPKGISSAKRVAMSLGLSERTLHRRLRESNLKFGEVLSQFRMEESERLLQEGVRSFSEIALELGYSDQSAWSRAFRRIKKVNPAKILQNSNSSRKTKPI